MKGLYVEIKESNRDDSYYGYIKDEVMDIFEISCYGEVKFIHKDDLNFKISPIEPFTCSNLIAHEAMHTTHVINELIQSALLDHWYATANPEFYKKVEEAQMLLMEAYNIAANYSE